MIKRWKDRIKRHIVATSLITVLVLTGVLVPVFALPALNGEGSESSSEITYPFGEATERRTRNSKTFITETGYALDVSTGAIHYDDGGLWRDINTTLVPAEAPWDWRMEEAGYQAYFVEQFRSDMIVRFEKAGEWLEFQPEALQWWNDWEDLQIISMPTETTGVVTDNVIYWADAYGPGIGFQWETQNTRLAKLLIIDDLVSLPAPEPYMLEGPNLVLDLNINFSFSSGVEAYVMDGVWDESTQQFHDFVEFRDTNGSVLWAFMPLRAWDSGELPDEEMALDLKLNTIGGGPNKRLYLHVITPYDWLESAVYPIYIDATVDEQVEASTDDAEERKDTGVMSLTGGTLSYGASANNPQHVGLRFQTVNIPQGSTIDVAYVTVLAKSDSDGDPHSIDIFCEDVDDATTFISTGYDISNRPRTTDKTNWPSQVAWTTDTWYDLPSIVSAVQEVISRESWSANNDLNVLFISVSGWEVDKATYSYNSDSDKAAKLHVEWSTGEASPVWGYSY